VSHCWSVEADWWSQRTNSTRRSAAVHARRRRPTTHTRCRPTQKEKWGLPICHSSSAQSPCLYRFIYLLT